MNPGTASIIGAKGRSTRNDSWRGAEWLGLGLTQLWTITRTQDYVTILRSDLLDSKHKS